MNTAAVRRFRFFFITNTFGKQAIHKVKVKIQKKRSKLTTKYDENSKTATTVSENKVFQRTQHHADLQPFKVCTDVNLSKGPEQGPEQEAEQGREQGPEQGSEQGSPERD